MIATKTLKISNPRSEGRKLKEAKFWVEGGEMERFKGANIKRVQSVYTKQYAILSIH